MWRRNRPVPRPTGCLACLQGSTRLKSLLSRAARTRSAEGLNSGNCRDDPAAYAAIPNPMSIGFVAGVKFVSISLLLYSFSIGSKLATSARCNRQRTSTRYQGTPLAHLTRETLYGRFRLLTKVSLMLDKVLMIRS